MRRTNDLECRLTEWGKEYGGGKYEDNGWQGVSPLAAIMKYHGRAPQGLNPKRIETSGKADEIEAAVRKMERGLDGYRLAQVLRMEYMNPGKPFRSKADYLRVAGVSVTRSRYDEALIVAKGIIESIIRIRQERVA